MRIRERHGILWCKTYTRESVSYGSVQIEDNVLSPKTAQVLTLDAIKAISQEFRAGRK